MITMKYINAQSPYNFQWEKLKVDNEDRGIIAKTTNIHRCVWGVTENTQVFS